MNRIFRSLVILTACAASLASSCDGDPPPIEPLPDARLLLHVPDSAESGIVVRLIGAAGREVVAVDPSHRLFQSNSGGDLLVAIVGTIGDGPLLELPEAEEIPSVVIEQVSAPDYSLRYEHAGYGLQWE